jgi:multidrug transporter EmrE-like cation transporter
LSQLGEIVLRVLTTPILFIGYSLSAVSALIWLLVLSRFELSYAAPIFSAIYYVLLLIASAILFREDVSLARWVGAFFIVVGIGLIAQTQ